MGGATSSRSKTTMPTRSTLLVGSLLFLIIIFVLSLQLWSLTGERILWHPPSRLEGLVFSDSSDSPTRSHLESSAGIPESSTGPAEYDSNYTKRIWRSKQPLGRRSAAPHPATGITSSPTQANSEASLQSLKLNSTTSDQKPDVVTTRSKEMPLQLYALTADPPPGCQEAHCMEYLTASEKQAMKSCGDEVNKWYNRTPDDGICHFIDGQERLPVALASMQGSGNTWVRAILERTTGICTGYSICDYMTRVRGFIGESIQSGSVLVVETHDPSPQWNQNRTTYKANAVLGFGSAIYIVRNPYYSAIAEWNRLETSSILRNESRITPGKYFGELSTINCLASMLIYIYLVGIGCEPRQSEESIYKSSP